MTDQPSHIILNGKQTLIKSLLESVPTESNDLLDFLKEWYSDDDYIEVQTSGSTGKAKNIQLKKDFVAASARRTIDFFQLKPFDKILHCLPIQFIAGKLMVVRALIGELDLFIVEPSSDFQMLQNQKFAFAAMVPNQVSKLFDLGKENWNIEKLLIGGDAISVDLEQQLQKVNTSCYSSYGMTETATHIAIRKLNGNYSDQYYHCLKGIEVGLSKENCLEIFMPGVQTLCTTDITELKDNQTFKILGRSDNIIISGGIKFSPETIEKKLEPGINVPYMISWLPHKQLGKQLILQVEAEENNSYKIELETICKNFLEKYEQPRQIIFVSALPKTINGKLKRN